MSGFFTRFATWVVVLSSTASLMLTPSVAWSIESPFLSTRAYASTDLSAFSKWTQLIPRYNEQHSEKKGACDEDGCPAQQWEKLLLSLRGKPLATQIDQINRFFNRFHYITDKDNYGTDDYWETPYELMERGGDCEDYAVAKYISLRRLGVDENSLRIVIVQDMNLNGILHAVLEVNVRGTPYLLDNQARSVTPAAKVFHYRPIYAINAVKWWAFK